MDNQLETYVENYADTFTVEGMQYNIVTPENCSTISPIHASIILVQIDYNIVDSTPPHSQAISLY